MMGLPGSGKSTYAHRLMEAMEGRITGADLFRPFGPYDSRDNPKAWRRTWEQLREWMGEGVTPLAVDGTMLTVAYRMPALVEAKMFGYQTHGIWLDTPLHVTIERQEGRGANVTVPAATIRRMLTLWEEPKFSEGFDTLERIPFRGGEDAVY